METANNGGHEYDEYEYESPDYYNKRLTTDDPLQAAMLGLVAGIQSRTHHVIEVMRNEIVVRDNLTSRQVLLNCCACGRRGTMGKADYTANGAMMWGELKSTEYCFAAQWMYFP